MSKIKNYNQLKPISGETLYKAEACKDQLEIFIDNYGFHSKINYFDKFINFARTQDGWISFLIKENFIEKIKDEKTYEYGDIFRVKCVVNNTTTFGLLTQISGGVIAMISLTSGNRYRDGIVVRNSTHITKREINKIIGDSRWEHIPEVEINIRHQGEILP